MPEIEANAPATAAAEAGTARSHLWAAWATPEWDPVTIYVCLLPSHWWLDLSWTMKDIQACIPYLIFCLKVFHQHGPEGGGYSAQQQAAHLPVPQPVHLSGCMHAGYQQAA